MTSRLVVNNIDNDTGVTTIRLNPTYSSFELNNAERLRINSVGKVGIKTDNPTELLHLYATSAHRILLKREGASPSEVTFGNESNYAVITNNTNGIDLRTGSTPTSSMHIDQNGKVGIGTDNPQRLLHVGTSVTAEANLRIQGGADYAELRVKDSDNALTFHTNIGGAGSRESFSINGSTGLVSINAVTYSALDITTSENGTNGPEVQLIHNSASPAANDCVGQIRWKGKDSAGNTDLMARIQTIVEDPTSGQETAYLNFGTRGYSAFNPIFRLKNRGTASAPSYTTDDHNGIILDVYNSGSGSGYERYMNFIAKSAGNTNSNILFWTEAVGGSPTEKLRIKSDGTIQCGTSGVLQAYINNSVSGHQFISQCDDNQDGFEIYQQHGSTATRNTLAVYDNRGNSGAKQQSFAVRGDGVVLIQATSSSGSSDDNIGFTHVVHGTSPYIRIRHQYSNSTGHTLFHMLGASGNLIGEIKQDGSGGVTYHSASDYRLKENVVDLTGAITRLKNLKPKRFNFKISTDVTQDGFLAHELQEVVPIAVSGTKDEVVTDDSKSKIPTLADKDIGDPVYQTVDTSRVVPLLTAALQEAITKIETLETKVAALEGS